MAQQVLQEQRLLLELEKQQPVPGLLALLDAPFLLEIREQCAAVPMVAALAHHSWRKRAEVKEEPEAPVLPRCVPLVLWQRIVRMPAPLPHAHVRRHWSHEFLLLHPEKCP